MTIPGKPASNDAPMPSSAGDSMEQIRDLLFGEQQRLNEARMARAEASISALREHSSGQLAKTEQQLLDRLSGLATQGEQQHAALLALLQESLQSLQHSLEQRIDDLQTLLQSEQAQLAREIGADQDRLQAGKVDRKQLARMLSQFAEQIAGDD